MLPRIANGPIAKIKDAETKPSTKFQSLLPLNFPLRITPTLSSRSSIRKNVPIKAPNKSGKITTNIVAPLGN
jgi:hypothetical protein